MILLGRALNLQTLPCSPAHLPVEPCGTADALEAVKADIRELHRRGDALRLALDQPPATGRGVLAPEVGVLTELRPTLGVIAPSHHGAIC